MLSLSGYDLPTDQVVQTLLDGVTTSSDYDDAEVHSPTKTHETVSDLVCKLSC